MRRTFKCEYYEPRTLMNGGAETTTITNSMFLHDQLHIVLGYHERIDWSLEPKPL
jgi:hypothetical protein